MSDLLNPPPALSAESTAAIHASAADILRRIALPFVLFSACLTGFLVLSWLFLVPSYARVDVNGQRWTADELAHERTRLLAQVTEGEEQRLLETLSVRDDAYQLLKNARNAHLPWKRLQQEIAAQAKAVEGGTVVVDQLDHDHSGNIVVLRGDVRDAGPRSMTVLASFVELLQKSTLVDRLEPPAFTRVDDAIGSHSPFTITLHLR